MPKPHFEDFMEVYHPTRRQAPRPARRGRFSLPEDPGSSFDVFAGPGEGERAVVVDPYSAHPAAVVYSVDDSPAGTALYGHARVTGSRPWDPTPLEVLDLGEPDGSPAGTSAWAAFLAEAVRERDRREAAQEAEAREAEALRLMDERAGRL